MVARDPGMPVDIKNFHPEGASEINQPQPTWACLVMGVEFSDCSVPKTPSLFILTTRIRNEICAHGSFSSQI